MGKRSGIEAESVVTVDGECDMSCEVLGDDQIEFWFGPVTDGLHLYFDKSGFAKFMRVVDEMRARVAKIPRGECVELMVNADERSRRAHAPNL
ncbi:MAG TPA: hypothetical protein VFX16_27075 [Pseudonocardiaceae bacterium]|nr:hypothetical protein [Pseudonocardiaceae bacterium]